VALQVYTRLSNISGVGGVDNGLFTIVSKNEPERPPTLPLHVTMHTMWPLTAKPLVPDAAIGEVLILLDSQKRVVLLSDHSWCSST
jgi:hypothetical protein